MEGRWAGGQTPFGWRLVRVDDDSKELVIYPEQAEAIQWGCQRILLGDSLGVIAREWNRRGLTTWSGNAWDSTQVRRILMKPRNAGLLVHRGQVVQTELPGGKAAWEPIVSEEVWRAVVATLTDPSRRTSPGPTPRWLGTGLYRCGVCGGKVRAGTSGHTYGAVYRCRTSGDRHITRRAELVDAYVESVLLARLAKSDVMQLLGEEDPPDLDEIKARLAVQEAELGSWRRLAEEGEVTAVAFAKSEKAVLRRIGEIKSELAGAVQSPLLVELVMADDVVALWDAHREDLGWRRAALDLFVTVTIEPAPSGRPEGWKAGDPYFHTEAIGFDWKKLGGPG